ncbi:MAG: T9SS type A sorting domain-containing protein [Saprospiraceae bacterium]
MRFSFLFKFYSQNLSPAPWSHYVGSHYKTEEWSGWVRDYSRRLGNFILDSGEVVGQVDTILIQELFQNMASLPIEMDGTLMATGLGRDAQKVASNLDRIEQDSGALWRNLCRLQALKMLELPKGKQRIFWQIGNEISSPAYSDYLNQWAGQNVPCGGDGCNYDPFVIPVYAEYMFAPSVQGIREASQAQFGSPDSIQIILGSLTNAGSNAAFNWLETLLNYTIDGTFAPALKGKKVFELVDIISIHYMMGNSNSIAWRNWIDRYRDAWFGKGKIKGIWSTEEVGIRAAMNGEGAARGAANNSRYLEWAIQNQYTPTQCRTNYYAHDVGPTGSKVNDLNHELYGFLGETPLSLVDSIFIAYDNPAIESHAFLNADSTKGVIFSFLKSAPPQAGSISEIRIMNKGMGKIQTASGHYFSPNGHQILQASIQENNGSYILDYNSNVMLDSGKSVLLTLIETQPNLGPISTEELDLGKQPGFFPNPAIFQISPKNIDPFSPFEISVFDLIGNRVLHSTKQEDLDISHLPAGIFIVKIHNGNKNFTGKLLKPE